MTVKERPIIFSGPMVRAILEGRKTQTRRVVKPQPSPGCRYEINGATNAALHLSGEWGHDPSEVVFVPPTPTSKDHRLFCPYGQPGNRLWVRETWSLVHNWEEDGIDDWDGAIPKDRPISPLAQVWYRAGHPWNNDSAEDRGYRWRSPIHMPRWASRITLEIAGVRVERVQDISEVDAIAEGGGPGYMPNAIGSTTCVGHRPLFVKLWDAINGPRGFGWPVNPWVWVIEFKRISP